MANSPKRVVRTFDATNMVAGNMIGSSVFLLSGYAAAPVLDGTWLVVAWVVGGIMAILGALAIAELSTEFPEIGGDFLYLKKIYGVYPAFLYGWMSLMIFETGSIAILAVFGGKYLKEFLPGVPLSVPALASVLVIFFSGLHCLRITIGSRFQSILTVAKIGGVILLSIILFTKTSSLPPAVQASSNDGSPLIGLSRALIPIFFAYTGWNVAGYIAGEIHNPRKTLPFALIGGTLITTVIYVIVQLGFLKAVGIEAMRNEEMVPLRALEAVAAEEWSIYLTILIFVSVISSLSITIQTAGARVIQAMGDHEVFFRFTAKRHPRFNTPVNALMVQAAWCIVMLYAFKSISDLVDTTAVVMILFSALSISTMLKIGRGKGSENRYRTPLFPLVPVAYIGCALFVSWGVIQFHLSQDSILPAWGLGFLAVGTGVYYLWKRTKD
jgi:APA family basic amino acid/polyamine antiporter